jgi:hypothetical protein
MDSAGSIVKGTLYVYAFIIKSFLNVNKITLLYRNKILNKYTVCDNFGNGAITSTLYQCLLFTFKSWVML